MNNNRDQPEYQKVKKSLKFSIADGSFFAMMEGFTTSFISPFAIFLNSSTMVLSLLGSVPDLISSFLQLFSIKANEVFRSRKVLLVIAAFVQSLLWLPMLLIPRLVSTPHQGYVLMILYGLIISTNNFASPIWRSMMGDLVSEDIRGSYFGKRNKFAYATNFTSTIVAGLILQHFSKTNPLLGFTILFAIAMIARATSGLFLFLMYEKKSFNPNHDHHYHDYTYTLRRFLRDLNKSEYGKFVLFVCLFKVAVNISSPFFALYELKYLGFSYIQYTGLLAAEIISSFLFMGLWGKINDNFGSKNVLLITGFLIPAIPILYLFGSSYNYLLLCSAFSGAAWAGFNLAVGNFMFDASSPQERVRYVSYYNLLHGISLFIGSIVGGFILRVLPANIDSIFTIFFISGIARFSMAIFFLPAIKELRLVELKFGHSFFKYPIMVKPRQRFVQDPFDYYLAYEHKPKHPRPKLYIDPQFLDSPDPSEKRHHDDEVKKFMEHYGPHDEKDKKK